MIYYLITNNHRGKDWISHLLDKILYMSMRDHSARGGKASPIPQNYHLLNLFIFKLFLSRYVGIFVW